VIGLLVKGPTVLTDLRRSAVETGLNLQFVLFNLLVVGVIAAPLAQAMVWLFVSEGWSLVDRDLWLGLPIMAVVVLGVVGGDFVGYWRHRLEHTRLFWPGHAIHHSDTHATWLTSERVHPLNRLLTFVIDNGVLLLLGFPAEVIIANGMVRKNYGYLLHADLPWTFGPLGAVFVSPAMHRWHHATDRLAHDTNFAIVFAIFDRMFGTLRVPGPCDAPLGVSDPIPAGFPGHLAYPFNPNAYLRDPVTPDASSAGSARP
jgi:sterol desaturase/sphingolipid hydroxylase (fatty acid hydroxylase superfamily)